MDNNTPVKIDKILTINKSELQRETAIFLHVFAHPIKEREFSDLNDKGAHIYSFNQIAIWVDGGTNHHVTKGIISDFKAILELMNKNNSIYFKTS